MNNKDYVKIFEDTEALMYGHFVLSSGMHSDAYFQCAKVLQYPKYLSLFADILYYYEVAERADINALMSWACWAVPLLFTEAILQYRKTFN